MEAFSTLRSTTVNGIMWHDITTHSNQAGEPPYVNILGNTHNIQKFYKGYVVMEISTIYMGTVSVLSFLVFNCPFMVVL